MEGGARELDGRGLQKIGQDGQDQDCARIVGRGRQIRVRVAFAPTRLSCEHLRDVYEALVPIAERAVRSGAVDVDVKRPRAERRPAREERR
jgi:hypothetical protein